MKNEELHFPDSADLFGTATSDEDINVNDCYILEEFYTESDKPRGLILLPQAISLTSTARILSEIPTEQNQHVYFSHLPPYLQVLSQISLPYLDRNPVFDQAIINKYREGDSLPFHIDLPKFDDGILICNLKGRVLFAFKRDEKVYNIELNDGDCLILTGDSRFEWTHGFEHCQERISVTMRRMVLNKDGICEI